MELRRMAERDKDSKLFFGVLIGGIVGIGALSIFLATRSKEPPLSTIGEAIVRVGEIFEGHGLDEPAAVRNVEKKIHKHENAICEVMDWVATGIQLWQKLKR